MLFAEEHTLSLLLFHAILGGALVAATTHLAIWMRGFPRRRFAKLRAARKLAAISVTLFATAFITGNLLYPTYKIRVRGEYLEEGTAVIRDYRNRREARDLFRARNNPEHAPETAPPPNRRAADSTPTDTARDLPAEAYLPRNTAKLARWFDVKEHWVALGLALSAACALLLFVCDPRRAGPAIGPACFALALCAAATAWLGAVIGLIVAATRSVVGLG